MTALPASKTATAPTPTVSRAVHFVPRDGECWAATVAGVADPGAPPRWGSDGLLEGEPARYILAVLDPEMERLFFVQAHQDEYDHLPQTFHWPERA